MRFRIKRDRIFFLRIQHSINQSSGLIVAFHAPADVQRETFQAAEPCLQRERFCFVRLIDASTATHP